MAVVGHTGAGKTTLISLLLRFYDVQRGAIRIDGVDIRDMDLADLRRRFGVVLQDPFLFTGTVDRNIRLGTEWIQPEEMERAAEEVDIAEFIRSLPDGFQEKMRERGSTLSTGQKQLISFARALAHDPKILVLDEATSSVDTETELRVREALTRLVDGTNLVDHRPPPFDHSTRRYDHRHAQGESSGNGNSPAVARPAWRLLEAVSAPIQGSGSGSRRGRRFRRPSLPARRTRLSTAGGALPSFETGRSAGAVESRRALELRGTMSRL